MEMISFSNNVMSLIVGFIIGVDDEALVIQPDQTKLMLLPTYLALLIYGILGSEIMVFCRGVSPDKFLSGLLICTETIPTVWQKTVWLI